MWKKLVVWLAKQGAQWAIAWARKRGWVRKAIEPLEWTVRPKPGGGRWNNE